MKRIIPVLIIILSACGRTGTPILDNALSPRKACDIELSLQNSSSESLTMSLWASQFSMSNDCSPYATAEIEKAVPPGGTGSLHAHSECRSCGLNPHLLVFKAGQKSVPVFSGGEKISRVVCTDTACIGQ